jgi:dihydroorotase
LRAFASENGPAFYGLPVNTGTLTLKKQDTPVKFPSKIETPEGQLTVFDPGFDVFWSAE